jgi:hypothetical protein
MPVSSKTEALVKRRWRAFCEAVVKAGIEHGRPIEAYFGEGQHIVDIERLGQWHEADGSNDDWQDGGCCLILLPDVAGFGQDGGGW